MDNNATSDGARLSPIIREYMQNLAKKSVEVQKKKYGKLKFKEMGKKAGETHTRKALERKREAGELPEAILK